MVYRVIIILLSIFSFNLIGQTDTANICYRWGVDKPNLKLDSITFTKFHVETIRIFEASANDSAGWNKEMLIATWNIKYNNGYILESKIKKERPNFQYPFEILNKKTDRLLFSKDKIVETFGEKGLKFKFSHFLNESGQIIKTVNKCIECRFESRYNGIGWVEYKYSNGLLTEAIYYGDGSQYIKGYPYFKYIFIYISSAPIQGRF